MKKGKEKKERRKQGEIEETRLFLEDQFTKNGII
jgi:hypothetical protein